MHGEGKPQLNIKELKFCLTVLSVFSKQTGGVADNLSAPKKHVLSFLLRDSMDWVRLPSGPQVKKITRESISHNVKSIKTKNTMAKINFTQEHFNRLKELAVEMLFENDGITTKFGQVLTIVDLLHSTTIGMLNDIRIGLTKGIEKLESQDEWVAEELSQRKLDNFRAKKELVNLIIGYKRYQLEVEAAKKEKETLTKQLQELKESQKTPEDKIRELEEKLASLDAVENF